MLYQDSETSIIYEEADMHKLYMQSQTDSLYEDWLNNLLFEGNFIVIDEQNNQ